MVTYSYSLEVVHRVVMGSKCLEEVKSAKKGRKVGRTSNRGCATLNVKQSF